MQNLDNLTVIIVTYLTQKQILTDCLKSISKDIKVKIIENSSSFEFKDEIIQDFSNVEIHCTGENLGYGKGNNYGIKNSKTDYVLILNPDLICDENFFYNLNKILETNNDFAIVGCQSINDKIFMPAGFFDNTKNTEFKEKFKLNKLSNFEKVEWVTGCSMLINLKKFKNEEIFDKNFFLYFEEFDLCKQVIKRGEKIFTSRDLRIHHYGFQSSLGKNQENKKRANRIREWHWMWSSFYFYKKNYGYMNAIYKMSGKFFRSFFKITYYAITFQKEKKEKYIHRFLGMFNSLIGKPSYFRDE